MSIESVNEYLAACGRSSGIELTISGSAMHAAFAACADECKRWQQGDTP